MQVARQHSRKHTSLKSSRNHDHGQMTARFAALTKHLGSEHVGGKTCCERTVANLFMKSAVYLMAFPPRTFLRSSRSES